MSVKKILTPGSLDEAYKILQSDKKSIIVAGNTWLQYMASQENLVLVDIKNLDLDYVHSTTFTIQVGSGTSLAELENCDLLNAFNNSIFTKSLKDCRTPEFRQKATVGGNLALKYGYSDLITALLVTDPMVLFYGYEKEALEDIHNEHLSYIPLEDYLKIENIRDIMTELVIPKTMNSNFVCKRSPENGRTLLNVAVARYGSQLRVAIGARPYVAKLWRGNDKTPLTEIVDSFDFGDDEMVTAEERKDLAMELILEAYKEIDFR
ncbi:MAG: FAD binding domain-containing protein [Bacillota bacterium]|jgi:CO/xanthine dehydrogenase FAD-binding subunit